MRAVAGFVALLAVAALVMLINVWLFGKIGLFTAILCGFPMGYFLPDAWDDFFLGTTTPKGRR